MRHFGTTVAINNILLNMEIAYVDPLVGDSKRVLPLYDALYLIFNGIRQRGR